MAAINPGIETFQNDWELEQLVNAVDWLRPESILEIGSWHGGTLWHWLHLAQRVVIVDDQMRRLDDWYDWARDECTGFSPICGMSNDEDVVEAVSEHALFDFLFIDADHSYDSVRADWDNYSPMVREGGLVALHDIIERPGYGVSRLWQELKSVPGCRWVEINQTVEHENESRCGIGLIYL